MMNMKNMKRMISCLFVLMIFSSMILVGCTSKTFEAETSTSGQTVEEPAGTEEAEIASGIDEMDEIDQLDSETDADIKDLDNLVIE